MADVRKLKCTEITKSLQEIGRVLKEDLGSEVVCEVKALSDKALLMCFEEYYFRCNNYVALTVLLTESEEGQEAVVASFAGGAGLSNVSMGANTSFAAKAGKSLGKLGFVQGW